MATDQICQGFKKKKNFFSLQVWDIWDIAYDAHKLLLHVRKWYEWSGVVSTDFIRDEIVQAWAGRVVFQARIFAKKTKVPEYLPKSIKQYVEVTLCLYHNSGNKMDNLNMKIQVARKRLNADINRRNLHLLLQQMQ